MSCALGDDRGACFRALCGGQTGLGQIAAFERSRYAVQRAFEIDDRAAAGRDESFRATRWLIRSIRDAIADAELGEPTPRLVVLVGTGLRELRSLELWWLEGTPMQPAQLHFGDAARRGVGRAVRCHTISNACSSSSFALGLGQDLLELGEADAVIVAGVDSITESMFGLLDRVNPHKPTAVQPFACERRGTLMGEGAAAVVLEPEATARDRGRRPLARLRGVGMGCDAQHETAPDHEGMLRVMRDAHRRAGIEAADVDLLVTHGTGTVLNDEAEARASRELFGEAGQGLVSTALKCMTGHTSGASGLMGVVTAIECLEHGRVPPTLGDGELIAAARELSLVRERVCSRPDLRIAQVNAFGFGGVNAVALLEAWRS